MITILCEAIPAIPTEQLPSSWVGWIIAVLILVILVLGKVIHGIFKDLKEGIKSGWGDVKEMHDEAMDVLKDQHDHGIRVEGKLDNIQSTVNKHETALNTLNIKVKCKESD